MGQVEGEDGVSVEEVRVRVRGEGRSGAEGGHAAAATPFVQDFTLGVQRGGDTTVGGAAAAAQMIQVWSTSLWGGASAVQIADTQSPHDDTCRYMMLPRSAAVFGIETFSRF